MPSRYLNWAAVWAALLFSLALGELLDGGRAKGANCTHFDYVIVGGGNAGLVVASRLSEDPRVTVAVIEAGDFQRNNPNVTNTTVVALGKNTQLDWQYEVVPQVYGGNHTFTWSAGKGVGGSTLINGTFLRSNWSRGGDADLLH